MIGFIFQLVLPASYVICEDIIYLHDGTSIVGEIIESEPGKSYTLKKQDETIRVFKMEDVWKVSFEERGMYEDELFLKDGSIITGEIIGSIPGETYRIKTADKSVLIFKMDEVSRIELAPSPELPPPERGIKGRVGLGVNYPGVGLRIGLSQRFMFEARGQFGEGVSTYGGRIYYYLNPQGRICYFTGIEGALISFKGEVSEGSGYCLLALLGGEYFLAKPFSFQLDLGPVYIHIKDKETALSKSAFDYVVNLGLNLYLGGR
ncbi:TPA: hypothetical protein DCX15_03900 [bacterium]|nr:hypothetical protein [bacterium]